MSWLNKCMGAWDLEKKKDGKRENHDKTNTVESGQLEEGTKRKEFDTGDHVDLD